MLEGIAKRAISVIAMVSVIVSWSVHSESEVESNKALHQLFDDIWQYEIEQFPNLARSEGKTPKRPIVDMSFEAMKTRNKDFKNFAEKLNAFDLEQLSESDRISVFMQKYRVQNYIDDFDFANYRVPITSEYGFHSSTASAVNNFRISNAQSFQDYIALLNAIPEYFEHQIQYMREGIKLGHTQPKVVLLGYEETIAPYTVDSIKNGDNVGIKDHSFFKKVSQQKAFSATDSDLENLKSAVMNAASAYQAFYDFFTNEYRPNAKEDIAAKTWPDGEAYYANRAKYYTTTDLTPKEIHQIGLEEVARIRAEMEAIIEQVEFEGSFKEFVTFLRTDPRFYARTSKELIIYASYVSKQIDAKLPQLFYKMPRTPYGVAPVPDSIAPKYTTGRYISPRRDDQPGYYWVNTYALDKRPLYAIPALTLHEAVPGHHFQISLAAEMQDLPKVRRSTYISAFGEGWGLYSEYLGLEVGIYEDPYDNFGRLSYEMWRACRLVVDTGMHMFGWSRDKALQFMMDNTALSEHNVRTEIDRYISWPAQALAYKIGEIKIKELRRKAEKELGDKFDLRAFHDAVLINGSVPLDVLEQQIEQFIQKNKSL